MNDKLALEILQRKPESYEDIAEAAKIVFGSKSRTILQDIDSSEGMAGLETNAWGSIFKDLSDVLDDVQIVGQNSLTRRFDNLRIPEEQGGAITENADQTPRLTSSLDSPTATLVHYGFSKRISDISTDYSDFGSSVAFIGNVNSNLDTYGHEQLANLIVAGAESGSGFLATNDGMVGVISASSALMNGQLPVAVAAFTSSAASPEDVKAVYDELGDQARTNGYGKSDWVSRCSPVAFKSLERVLQNSGSIEAMGEFNNNRKTIKYDLFTITADRHLSTRDIVAYKRDNIVVSFGKGTQAPKTKVIEGETYTSLTKTFPFDVVQADASGSLFARFGLE